MSVFDRDGRGNVLVPFQSIDASQLGYTNPRLPSAFNGTMSQALDAVIDGIWPNFKGTAATFAALPATGNTVNDFWIVTDDGDGKPAGYVWQALQGAGAWVKRYDVDWTFEGILGEFINRTEFMYAAKYGTTDKDALGVPITGTFAGQRIYGGDQTGQSLTLLGNAIDATGFVQTSNTLRPTADQSYDLGTSSFRWKTLYASNSVVVGTTTLAPGVLSDSGGALSFGSNDVTSTGFLKGASLHTGTMTISSGSILDTSGAITFGTSALTTTGVITGGTGSTLADITFTNGTFHTLSTAFGFSSQDVGGIGALTSASVSTSSLQVQNVLIYGNTVTTNNNATRLLLQGGSGGSGVNVEVNAQFLTDYDATITGKLTVSGTSQSSIAGALAVNSALVLSNNSSNGKILASVGDLQLTATSGAVSVGTNLIPATDAALNLGSATKRFQNLYLSAGISDGTNTVSTDTLLTFRASAGTIVGQGLFWDGAKWIAVAPGTEIDHTTLQNLTVSDSGHTQFAMLLGRTGGQTLSGDTAASGNLTLSSTSHATKGLVLVKDNLSPYADATYSSGWNGISLGGSSRNFNNLYSKGVHFGLRFEQYAGSGTYPTNSGQNVGRVIFDTTSSTLAVDTGSAWVNIGAGSVQKYYSDTTWDGSQLTQTFTVSGLSDARISVWQLLDNTNGFEQIHAAITKTSTTSVTVTTTVALPAGSYRLIGEG